MEEIKKAAYAAGIPSFRYYKIIDSTNTEARRYALSGGKTPAVFVAEGQSGGRGRIGRSFYSPSGAGIYLSLLIEADECDCVFMTSAVAVAVRRAILAVTGIETGIKWVNDIYLDGKKVAGILVESFFQNEKRYFIIGIGINIATAEFPEEIRSRAGSLGIDPLLRSAIGAKLIGELCCVVSSPASADIIEEYRKSSVVIGKRISFTENGVTETGVAEGINEYGHLLVRLDGGSEKILCGGEITLRVNEE